MAVRADAYDPIPPRRFEAANQRYADQPSRMMLQRIGLVFLVLLIIVVGILLIPLPGPGWVITIAGFGLLSRESRAIARGMDYLEHRMWRVLRRWYTWRGKLLRRTDAIAEVLCFTGCPHDAAAVELVEDVAREFAIKVDVRRVEVTGPDDAEQQRFLGSPTVRVDGRDVEPGADARDEYSMSCRIFRTRAGSAGVPDTWWVVEALLAGVTDVDERTRIVLQAAAIPASRISIDRAAGLTPEQHPASGQPTQLYRRRCARNLLDLVYELTAALDSHDVNRVAGLYHWVGMSSSGAVSVMDRLDMIAQRPLVDIVPVYPASAQGEGDYYPRATVRRAPIGLRLEQTLSNGSTPSRTMLGLRRYLGCWWVHL